MTLLQPRKVRVTPSARRPRHDVPEVLVELEVLEFVVQEHPDVPGQVVVTVDQRHFLEQPSRELQSLFEGGT